MGLLTLDTTYQGVSTATAKQIDTAFAKYGVLPAGFGQLVVDFAQQFGFRSEALAGQISEETGWLKNWWTTAHWNVMSIGVTGEVSSVPKEGPDWQRQDTPQGPKWLRGYRFSTLAKGILAGCIHMAYYVYGTNRADWPLTARQYHGDTVSDPRLPALLATSYPGTIRKIGDLGNGRYAANPSYGKAIVSRGNSVLGMPNVIERRLGVPANSIEFYAWLNQRGIRVVAQMVDDGWVGRGGMQPEAIVHHITDGESVMGSINWWRNANVDGSTHQLIAALRDPDFPEGTLVIARKDEDQAWANGAWGRNPRTDLETIKRWYTQNINPNRVTLSREHSGKPNNPKLYTEKVMNTSFFADLNWMAKYPLIQPTRAHLLRHADIDPTNRANCPGPYFPLDDLIRRILADIANTPEESASFDNLLAAWDAVQSGKVSVEEAWVRLRKREK